MRQRYPLLDQGFNSVSPNQLSYRDSPIIPVVPLEDHTTSLHPSTTVVCHSVPLSLERYSPFGRLIKKTSQHHQLSGVTTVTHSGTGTPSVLILTPHAVSPGDVSPL